MKIGSKGRRPARRRVGSGASPAPELPLWSKLIPAAPVPLERFQHKKKPPTWGGCANAVRKRSLGAAKPPHCLFSFNYFLRPIAPAAATRAITA